MGRAAERLGAEKGKERIDGDWVGEGFSRVGSLAALQLCKF